MERKKLVGNGIWESSRFMLPEHEARIIMDEREQLRRTKPELDAQEWEIIDRALYYSMADHSPVTLSLWDPFTDRQAKGIVMKVDNQLRRLKLRWSEEDWDWIEMSEILAVTT